MAGRLREIALLVMLLAAMDQLYRWLHPDVDFVRAALVGATAWLTLRTLELARWRVPAAGWGAGVVFAAAFVSVALIRSGWLVSRSTASVAIHAALVVAAVLASGRIRRASRSVPS